MRQIRLLALGVWIGSILLAGCNLDSFNDPVVVAEVNDEFHIDLWENLSPFGSSLVFKIQTIEEFECKNYSINYNVVPKFREFSISLNEIQEPGDCEQGINTARASINLGTLTPGFYQLNIDLKNTVFNQGQLTVSSERYLIEMEDAKGINFVRRELFRIPGNTIWGYIAYADGAEPIADDFIHQLEGLSQSKSLKKGYYGYFSVENDNSDQIIFPQLSIAQDFKPFLFHYDSPESEIAELVDHFRADYGQDIQISLTNDEGRSF